MHSYKYTNAYNGQFSQYITNTSKNKLDLIQSEPIFHVHNKLKKLLIEMELAFGTELKITLGDVKIDYMHGMFQEFVTDILKTTKSKFETDLKKMNSSMSINFFIGADIIKINFIFNNNILVDYVKYIAVVLHSLNTFCHLFPNNYSGLEINVCLDQNLRNMDIPEHITSITNKIIHLQKQSLAFNVSGVTYPRRKIINLTRQEELIKLLFHEMIHFIKLDHILTDTDFKNTWAVNTKGLNLSESYTEFFSAVLYSMYESIHLSKIIPIKSDAIFKEILATEIEYSICLTSNILKFYNYDETNYKKFFKGTGTKITQPILLVEYIFLKSILLLNLDNVLDIIPDNYKIKKNNLPDLFKIFLNDNDLIIKLESYMKNNICMESVSYLAIDLDWSLI